jgi:hypothetical protein
MALQDGILKYLDVVVHETMKACSVRTDVPAKRLPHYKRISI